jgi:tetratricopeptide (TPR) repeat protein
MTAVLGLALLQGCGGGGAARHGQVATRQALEPARLVATPGEVPCSALALGVRFRADERYRAQHVDWKRDADQLLRWANEVLGPTACVVLEPAGHEPWDGRQADDLEAMLAELEALDPGDEVHLVIGLVDALPAATSDLHALGRARVLGRHLVLRGLDDADEAVALREALSTYPAGEQSALLDRRGRHKLTVTLLHELGHALGAMHVTDEARIMAPTYSPQQARFGPEAASLLRAVIGPRVAGDPRGFRAAVKAHLQANRWDGWNADELAVLEAELALDVAPAGDAAAALGPEVRPEDKEQFRAAARLMAASQPHEAWEILERLRGLYPAEAGLAVPACEAGLAAGKEPRDLAAVCGALTGSAELRGQLAAIEYLVAAGKTGEARAALAAAVAGPAGTGTDEEADWLRAARLARTLGALAIAEAAATRAGSGGGEIAAWAAGERARWALPRGAVAAEAEDDALASLREALKKVYARDAAGARKLLAAIEKQHGDLAGVRVVRCDLALREKKYGEARGHCQRALAADPDAGWAHYLLGLLDLRDKQPAAAEAHLEAAVRLLPDVKDSWKQLATLYRRGGSAREAKLKELEAAYQKRFGAALK